MNAFALILAAAIQSSAPPPVDCNDADHSAFDFWIGDWDVLQSGSTTVVARSRIEKIVGCAISESYDQSIGPGGKPTDYHGRSISSYVPADKAWRQFYVDSGGSATSFIGGIIANAMVFTRPAPAGLARMTFTPNADGTVRQHGELSGDGGKTWSATFDFTYRRR